MKTKSTSDWIRIAIVSCIISTFIEVYQAWHHYSLSLGLDTKKSICNVSAQFNCDLVNTSVYSSLGGISIGLWGAVTNLLLAFFIFYSRNSNLRIAMLGSGFVALVSIVMGTLSITQLKTICLFCVADYILSLLTFFSLLKASRGWIPLKSDFLQRAPYLTLLAVPALTFGINFVVIKNHAPYLDYMIQESIAEWKTNPVIDFPQMENVLYLKPKDGKYKLTLVEFADFLCPHCKHAAPMLHAFAASRADVQLIFYNFPLDSNCNEAMPRPGSSCQLAKSIYCAEKVRKGWMVHEWLFENQGKILEHDLKDAPEKFGMDPTAFQQCLDSQGAHNSILAQAKLGSNAKIAGTPSIFANGKKLENGFMIPLLERVYRALDTQ